MTKVGAIRILTVDDHPLICRGIAALVEAQPDLDVVAEAATGEEAIKQFRAHRPDVTLMDINLPQMSGLDAISLITREFPDARIVVLTTAACDAQVLRALKAGVSGYLLKSTLHRELIAAIRAVHTGKKFLSAEVTFEVAEHLSDDPLTSTEIGVLRLIAEGMANKEIAADLSMSESTVKGHVRSLLSKLGVDDRTHAAMVALKRGIIKMPTG